MNEVRTYNGHGEASGRLPVRAEGGGDFLASLQNAVRENPVSAALIGMGVFWMFMGGSNVSLFGGSGRKSMFGTAAQGAGQFAGAAQHAGRSIGYNANQAAQTILNPAWQAGSAAAGAMGDAASRTTDAAVSGYQASAEMASRTAEAMTNATTATASALQETTAKWSRGVQGMLSDLFERQPLLLGAVGLAVGAGIAASLPTTEVENQVMGEASDFVRQKVSDQASEVTGQVKAMADAAADEAKAQGITAEKVGETFQALGNKITGDRPEKEQTGRSYASGGKPGSSRKS